MKLINRTRRSGKTTMLICTAHTTGMPIIVENEKRKGLVQAEAEKLSMSIEIFTEREYREHNYSGMEIKQKAILIDEGASMIQRALEYYFGAQVVACTITKGFEDADTVPARTGRGKEKGEGEFVKATNGGE